MTTGVRSWEAKVQAVMRRRWLIYLVANMVFFMIVAQRVAPVVVADRIMAEYQITGTVFGGIVAVYFYVYAIMQIPAGGLADYLGPKFTLTSGAVLAGVGTFLFGWGNSLTLAYISRFTIGLGSSTVFLSLLRLVTAWYHPREFASLTGGTTIIAGMGAVAASVPLALLSEHVGWRASFQLAGVFTLIGALICWLVIQNSPEDCGLPTIKEIEERQPPTEISDKIPPPSGRSSKLSQRVPPTLALRMILRNRHTWPPFFAFFGMYGSVWPFASVLSVPYMMQVYGLERGRASVLPMLITGGFGLAGPVVGIISDRLQRRKVPFVVCAFCCTILWAAFTLWDRGKPPLTVLYVLCFLLGVCAAGSVLNWACAKEVNHPAAAAMASATTNTGGMLATALMQPLLGFLLDLRWQGELVQGTPFYSLDAYRVAIYACFLVSLVGFAATLLVKETYTKNTWQDDRSQVNVRGSA